MDFDIRPITSDEFPTFARAAGRAFGEHVRDEEIDLERKIFDMKDSIGVFDGSRMVGTGVLFPFELTVPGGGRVPAGGVSWISVQPDYRRKGILTAMMRRQLEDIPGRGEKLGILYASESVIYGRFGYGMATSQARYEIDTRHRHLVRKPDAPGTVRLIDKDEAAKLLPPAYRRAASCQPGALSLSPNWWEYWLTDPERWWRDSSGRFYAVYEAKRGKPEGFVAYRISGKWDGGFAQNKLMVMMMVAATPAARVALWQFCLEVDLVTTVNAPGSLPEEPLRWMLADPRRLTVKNYGDGLWARLVDIPACLEARRYLTEGELVLEVTDRFCEGNGGRFLLAGSPEGATCRPSRRSPDLRMQVDDLGAIYLGGATPSVLAEAGRIEETKRGALRRADLMFASERPPFCPVGF
jgi:predicted acetyltransferase